MEKMIFLSFDMCYSILNKSNEINEFSDMKLKMNCFVNAVNLDYLCKTNFIGADLDLTAMVNN
tara:strand:- start:15842 stop:16030 length:189 start_codon:yes stop_codon:yes gene_type:complete